MTVDGEPGSTVETHIAVPVMLFLGLPEVAFGRRRELLGRRCSNFGLRGCNCRLHRRGHRQTVAFPRRNRAVVDFVVGRPRHGVGLRIAEGCARRNHADRANRRDNSGKDVPLTHLCPDQPARSVLSVLSFG